VGVACGPAQDGRRGRHEVRPIWCLHQQPSEGLERDIRTRAEFAEQFRHPPVGQAGSNLIEQFSRDQPELLGDEMADSQADHRITGIIATDNLADRRGQERVPKLHGRSAA
jgi:hypothetical protein